MADKTNFGQALMHMIKGNLGAGILAMPASFAHTGLVGGTIGLPLLCLVSAYCVHLLLRSSQQLESKCKGQNLDYATLAKHSFKCGPTWLQKPSDFMSRLVDSILLITQIGVCCVYIVFVVDNITSILASYSIVVSKGGVFSAVFPFIILLSFIRTLKRLAIASLIANMLQAVGLALILEYLLRDLGEFDLTKRENFMPLKDMALGFGSAMFAFEGISVVLPVYSRLKTPSQMAGCCGVVNLSFIIILVLYFIVGLFGYLRFGHHVRDSITLNLPAEPIYDAVRAMFTGSIILSYPLQFYVPNEIIWNWIKNNMLIQQQHPLSPSVVQNVEIVIPSLKPTIKEPETKSHITTHMNGDGKPEKLAKDSAAVDLNQIEARHEEPEFLLQEYCCRALVVTSTFLLAFSVPKLNLLMDLVGSLSGTALSLTLPATIHLATFWNETRGFNKTVLVMVDAAIIIFSLFAGGSGSVISLSTILKSFSRQ